MQNNPTHLTQKEFNTPETTYSQVIEDTVLYAIIARSLTRIPGVHLPKPSLLTSWFRNTYYGIDIVQDVESSSLKISVDLIVQFGHNLPQKAQEIQQSLDATIRSMTGMRVSEVNITFKEISPCPEEPTSPNSPISL